MANGGSWDRFWFTLVGFNTAFGRWPTRIHMPEMVWDQVRAHLTPADLVQLEARLKVILGGDDLMAEDEEGARHVYDGPPQGRPTSSPEAWLGIRWN